MRSRTARRLLLLSILLGMFAALPASGHAQRTSAKRVAATPVQAVLAVVRPYFVPGYNFYTCSRQLPMHRIVTYAPCPMTARLRHRLRQPRPRFSGLAFCRCQSAPRTVRVRQIDDNGRVAHVYSWWDLGPSSFAATFVVLHRGGGWLVDDEYCAGRPGTSIYTRAGYSPCR